MNHGLLATGRLRLEVAEELLARVLGRGQRGDHVLVQGLGFRV